MKTSSNYEDKKNQLCPPKIAGLRYLASIYGEEIFKGFADLTDEKNKLLSPYGFTTKDDLKGKFEFRMKKGHLSLSILDRATLQHNSNNVGMVRSDIEQLSEFEFYYIILDEAQAIKNPSSIISKSVKKLKAKNRISITGTPVENNTFDLYSQIDFLNPGLLGSEEFFKTEYANPIDKQLDNDKAVELRKLIYPFLLKRTKSEVAKDLPDKMESIIFCEMDTAQRKVYEKHKILMPGFCIHRSPWCMLLQ